LIRPTDRMVLFFVAIGRRNRLLRGTGVVAFIAGFVFGLPALGVWVAGQALKQL